MLFRVAAALLLLVSFGCGRELCVDATNDQTFKESLDAIRNSLSEDEREEFEESCKTILKQSVGNMAETIHHPKDFMARFKERIAGKTAAEIIAESRRVE